MTKNQNFALGQFLSEGWDRNLDFNEVLDQIIQGNLLIWEPFENYDASYVVEKIEDLEYMLNQEYPEGKE